MAAPCRLATNPLKKSQFPQESLPIHSISVFLFLLQCGVSTVIAQQEEALFSMVTHLDLPLIVFVCSVLSRENF